MNKVIAVLGLMLILGLMNWSIVVKEQHLSKGQIVKLKLAPVDPRSLMQGDYMVLRFELADAIYEALSKVESSELWGADAESTHSFVVVKLDQQSVASFVGLDTEQVLQPDQLKLYYRVRDGKIKFATNAFFFAEGTAELYNAAEYGEFRVNAEGEVLLSAMLDKDLHKLGPD
jgi:uncharacterized membrane-anchored protein